jgi:hypothetical protein
MSKSRWKIYKTQRDKVAIETAKYLKKAGILSKQTKLHGGKYISKEVLRKVRQYDDLSYMGYKAIKAPKKTVAKAKELGYQTVAGTRIIGPPTKQFKKRLETGLITGIKPVKGGYMEEVTMPHGVMDMYSLVEQLKSGIDDLKMQDEQFAFTFFGNESYRAFMDSQDLLNYLTTYKSIFAPGGSLKPEDLTEEFKNLVIFRLHKSSIRLNIRGATQRKKERRSRGPNATGRARGSKYSEKIARMHPSAADRYRKRMAEKAKAQREKMSKKELKEYRQKAAERARKSYYNRKGKK